MNNKSLKKPKAIRRIKKKIGDVIEIPTSKGLAYVQYTHEHINPPVWGSLIRVLQGFYKTRPDIEEIERIVNLPHRFQTFCEVHYGVNLGEFERIGNLPVPEFAQKFPVFKGTNSFQNEDSKDTVWWFWDGEKEWKVGKLSPEEQKKHPEHILYNGLGLIHAIESGKTGKRDLC